MVKLDLKEKFDRKIRVFTETIWKDKINGTIVNRWIENFVNADKDIEEYERLNALYLLTKFMYFGNKETREMLKTIYRDKFQFRIVKEIRKRFGNTTDLALIEAEFQTELSKTRFLGMGNPSESGIHLLYYFRQENNLSKKYFLNTHEIFAVDAATGVINLKDNSLTRYVFLDDFCGSGSQAIDYSKEIIEEVKKRDKSIVVSYYPLFATEYGIKQVKKFTLFDEVEPVFLLDESFKCFSTDSRYYTQKVDGIDKDKMKVICEVYGKSLYNPPLGYNDCQLLVSFFHNTPDNTLPIFWSDKNKWFPFFKRYNKIY